MKKYFRSNTDAGSDWLIGSLGNSQHDGKDYHVTSYSLKIDQLPDCMGDPKDEAELISGLMNAYFNGVNVVGTDPEKVKAMGRIEDSEGFDIRQYEADPSVKPLF